MLPDSFRLNEPHVSLPQGATSKVIACRPVSGSSFAARGIIDVELPAAMWLDGASLSMRYKIALTAGTADSAVTGVPLYAPFARLQLTQAGATLDSIGNYSQMGELLTTLRLCTSDKEGRMNQYGYEQLGGLNILDGRLVAADATETFYVSGPLPCILTNGKKNIPLFAADPIRLTFTLASLTDMSYDLVANAQFVGMAITNFEVVATYFDLGREAERSVSMAPMYLKTFSFNSSSLPVASGFVGSQAFFFNSRYSSIRALFALPCSLTGAKSCEFDDLTSGSGDYSFQLNGQQFPQLPLSATLNNSGILTECLKAARAVYPDARLSINAVEYACTINTPSPNYYEIGKFIPSLSLLRCAESDDALLSGVSSRDTGVNVVVNTTTATTAAANLGLVLCFDVMLVIDPISRKMSVRS